MGEEVTEAGWTREKPKQEGYYWWRKGNELEVLHVWECSYLQVSQMQTDEGFGSMSLDSFIREYGGEFKGPITPDSYQQGRVAGLREAVPLACKYCNDRTKWTPMSNSGYHVCNMPEPGFVRCQAIKIHAALAQQAQDEKGVGDAKV